MLTEQQLQNLAPLCEVPRFGKILETAINVWKQDTNPDSEYFGVTIICNNAVMEFYQLDSSKKCCLMGGVCCWKIDKTIAF